MAGTDFPEATGPLAQGYAKLANEQERNKDAAGVTFPNLHRRIDPDIHLGPGELVTETYYLTTEDGYRLTTEDGDYITIEGVTVDPDTYEYMILVAGVNSYRHTKREPPEEIVEEDEIP